MFYSTESNIMKSIVVAIIFVFASSGCGVMAYKERLSQLQRDSHLDIYKYSIEMRQYIIENGEKKGIEAAQLALKRGLKDPESAMFRNVRTEQTEDGIVVCGEYNAKNSYGGYVGFNRFVAGSTRASTYDASSGNQDIIWASNVGINKACPG